METTKKMAAFTKATTANEETQTTNNDDDDDACAFHDKHEPLASHVNEINEYTSHAKASNGCIIELSLDHELLSNTAFSGITLFPSVFAIHVCVSGHETITCEETNKQDETN
jgi:hypothetical protein